ncbi:tannase/feruloyl esterase family alpha/beta hydrolase [Qaidamihabitans albus]|uniref:tannase/feruloyl esterase family alpha/beta hydrolase n=1 Tax=Qaidamihabitans albus TaxID=2795733 RepID=UPI0018F1D584
MAWLHTSRLIPHFSPTLPTCLLSRTAGGKLLFWTGGAEPAARTSRRYYSRMQAAMGPARVDSFVRYYEIPGAQHGPSSVFQPEWNQLATIESWVEKGIDPANNIVATDGAGVPVRTRPLCMFPSWPKYNGTGDVNNANPSPVLHRDSVATHPREGPERAVFGECCRAVVYVRHGQTGAGFRDCWDRWTRRRVAAVHVLKRLGAEPRKAGGCPGRQDRCDV